MPKFSPTDEQITCIDMARAQRSFKVVAYAGAGKTTTLRLISDDIFLNYPRARGLYLAFNKSIALAAKGQFDARIQTKTFHALAFAHVPRTITQKVSSPKPAPMQVAKALRLDALSIAKKDGGHTLLGAARLAQILMAALTHFCKTHAPTPAPRHIKLPDWVSDDARLDVQEALFCHLDALWQYAIDPRHPWGIGHDVYLKYWTLSNPIIPADFVLFDEAQDADPLMMGVLLKQRAQIIYVGDAHQQIYEWRGATNAMKKLPLPQSLLTQSFRFGQAIADKANLILRALHETTPLHGNPHQRSTLGTHAPHAVLCRTNAGAMARLLWGLSRGHKVALHADTGRMARFCADAKALMAGARASSAELLPFNSWREVQDFHDDGEIGTWVRLIDEHGADTLLKTLDKLHTTGAPDYTILTAHKAKGLEWGNVTLHDDFYYTLNQKALKISPEELRLLYVAITRAKFNLDISAHGDLFAALKTHSIRYG